MLDTDRDEKLTQKEALRLWGLVFLNKNYQLGFYVKSKDISGYEYLTKADILQLSRPLFKENDIKSNSHV